MSDDFDPILCPYTWTPLVGHAHSCSRTRGHSGVHECLCGTTMQITEEGASTR